MFIYISEKNKDNLMSFPCSISYFIVNALVSLSTYSFLNATISSFPTCPWFTRLFLISFSVSTISFLLYYLPITLPFFACFSPLHYLKYIFFPFSVSFPCLSPFCLLCLFLYSSYQLLSPFIFLMCSYF